MAAWQWKKAHIGFLMLAVLVASGCGPYTATVVQLNRDRYVCKNDSNQFSKYRGKKILLSSIINETKNTVNLGYFNPDRTIGYQMYYSLNHSIPQPIESYYWYSLKKGFECVGIQIEESGRIYDAELYLTIQSLNDEEMKFGLELINKGTLAYKQNYTVRMPKVQGTAIEILEERAYRMLDSIVATILNDPGFQDGFFRPAS